MDSLSKIWPVFLNLGSIPLQTETCSTPGRFRSHSPTQCGALEGANLVVSPTANKVLHDPMQGFHVQGFLSDFFLLLSSHHCSLLFSTLVITSENTQNFDNSSPVLSASHLEGPWGCTFWAERCMGLLFLLLSTTFQCLKNQAINFFFKLLLENF